MCEQVSVGVCDWGWFAPAESHHRWAISVPVMLSPLSDPCSVCGRRLRSVSGSWFRDSWALLSWTRFLSPAASWTPIAGPWLPIASLRYPPLPYGKLRFCLRKAPLLPTESSASAYGKLRLCLRKAPPLPTESSAIHFVFWLFLSINLFSCNWILQALVCDRVYLEILESVYGSVEDGDELLAKFMGTLQNQGEKSSDYLHRLQVILSVTIRRGALRRKIVTAAS